MGVEAVIDTFREPGEFTVKRTARGVYINGRYKLAAPWAATTLYASGVIVTNAARSYQVITGGTSAGSGGPTTTASDIVDGTVHWKFLQENVVTIIASIRPSGGRGLSSPAQGEYSNEERIIFTKTLLRTRSPDHPDTESDVIVIPNEGGDNEDWQIVSVKTGRTFFRATAVRLVLP